jgi:hypothetical protein
MRLLAALTLLALCAAVPADARSHDSYHNGWGNSYDRWENRRDARRAGVVAGVVVSGIARSAAASNADERYAECMMTWGYDMDCERRFYEDRLDARRTGRAIGVTAGIITHEIVRD